MKFYFNLWCYSILWYFFLITDLIAYRVAKNWKQLNRSKLKSYLKISVNCYMFSYTRGCYNFFFFRITKGKVNLLDGINKLECFQFLNICWNFLSNIEDKWAKPCKKTVWNSFKECLVHSKHSKSVPLDL